MPDEHVATLVDDNVIPTEAVIVPREESIPVIEIAHVPNEDVEGVISIRNDALSLVEHELNSAKTALSGYAAEMDMLKASETLNRNQEQFSLNAPSNRLDELARLDDGRSDDHRSNHAAAMASNSEFALIREFRDLINMCTNGLTQSDMERVMVELVRRSNAIATTPDRSVGSMRLTGNLRVRREVGMDIARGFIREIENLNRQRRLISFTSQSIERERRRVPSLEALRADFVLKLTEFEEKMKIELSFCPSIGCWVNGKEKSVARSAHRNDPLLCYRGSSSETTKYWRNRRA